MDDDSMMTLAVLWFAFILFVVLTSENNEPPPINPLEQKALYNLLNSIDPTTPWTTLYPHDFCISPPSFLHCGSKSHIAQLNFGFISDQTHLLPCSPNATLQVLLLLTVTHQSRINLPCFIYLQVKTENNNSTQQLHRCTIAIILTSRQASKSDKLIAAFIYTKHNTDVSVMIQTSYLSIFWLKFLRRSNSPSTISFLQIYHKTLPYLQVQEYPGYKFIGLTYGPGGDNQKRLEKEIGAKIKIRGTKADTGEKSEIKPAASSTPSVSVFGDNTNGLNQNQDPPSHAISLSLSNRAVFQPAATTQMQRT
ncbi:unnamed protein product [Vicia faba]|uniref:KHDC4/BBP-like KH-domain type I domain-containing protein n=1 Tax=Vicia faba TaxID=3906 RepID=A0AAV0Z7W7_VICFA|nr:unnamed protein product [Vicia faba]